MGNQKIPDAWDEDWETQADRAARAEQTEAPAPQAPKSKAERWAEHRELNRQIWEAAEAPPEMYHVAATSNVPLTQGFKPQMKLLSRKPPPTTVKTKDPVTGMERLTIQDDVEEEDEKPPQPTPEEIRERQQRELEEKQRKYEETRAKIFGESPSGVSSGASTPGATTPPLTGEGGSSRGNYRGRGRGRGGRGGRGGQRNQDNYIKTEVQDRRPGNTGSPFRELFDPDAGPKPGSRQQQRVAGTASPPRGPEHAIRAPRGPDGSGRGGFGFASRGAKEG
ncbi:hypothetical protein KVR01_005333 [Diaporthe batatas]|uniref:uncharacterized protein n=1 Tax=Diaporthe batatas TaxID=748121 RepID=UPI001D03DC97|nr:uncharacterized protein KVR01_005333 [Diaporthe batatas]KAG8165058.1 hypothetical protein KVR01_005333 [Diaporthe batatas]